jgi:uncharacterized membrane protein YdjX (TVP38/TMEM64 family)
MKRGVLLVAVVATAVIASKLVIENLLGVDLGAALERWLTHAGPGGAAAVVALLGADIFLPVPSSLVMILSGAAFGVWWGSLLALAGSIGGEWLGFELVRRYGRRASRHIVDDNDLLWIEQTFARHGIAAVIVSRALPIVMETVSVVAGLSAMSRGTFLWTSLAGTAPIVLVYAYSGAVSREVGSVVPAVVMLLVVTAGGAFWLRARGGRMPRAQSPGVDRQVHPGDVR